MIRFKNVTKIFREEQRTLYAVKNVSFSIAKGEICGIIGYSGAGKSTLLRMVNGLEKTTSGEIHVDDHVITQLKGKALRQARQKIGMIFQHFHLLWSRTVRENIAFPLEVMNLPKKEIQQRVDQLIEQVGLTEHAHAYPAQLSGGQKQRVGIARAISTKPTVLLCDEATSALDPETTKSILSLLQTINKEQGITILLITHDPNVVASICEKMVVIDHGEIVEQGNVKDCFANPRHPLTKTFVSSVKDVQPKNKTLFIPTNQWNWERMEQLLRRFNVSVVVEPTIKERDDQVLSFRLQGDSHQIKAAEEALKSFQRSESPS